MNKKDAFFIGKVIGAGLFFLVYFMFFPDTAKADGYVYVEVRQAAKISGNWIGDYPTSVTLGFRENLNTQWYVGAGIEHLSNIGRGCDLSWSGRCIIRHDKRPETHIDQVFISVGYKFYSW